MSSSGQNPHERGEAVLAIFKRGADFMKQLMDENESLRKQLSSVEGRQHQAARDPADWADLRVELTGRIESLQDEKENILEQLRSVETENQQFAERYLEIEEENNNLANLYVASYQLHSTLDPSEVLKVILEIVINLIGAELFCVYVCGDTEEILRPVAAEGGAVSDFPVVRLGVGPVGESVESGEVMTGSFSDVSCSEGVEPVVCIPLRVEDRPIGAIVISRLLSQKDGFSALDHELFTLLAGHAATAIFASRLYAQSERKLSTIQGFIDLLTK
jgi:nitrate/nitrite-specific signal transduction histidine kinase